MSVHRPDGSPRAVTSKRPPDNGLTATASSTLAAQVVRLPLIRQALRTVTRREALSVRTPGPPVSSLTTITVQPRCAQCSARTRSVGSATAALAVCDVDVDVEVADEGDISRAAEDEEVEPAAATMLETHPRLATVEVVEVVVSETETDVVELGVDAVESTVDAAVDVVVVAVDEDVVVVVVVAGEVAVVELDTDVVLEVDVVVDDAITGVMSALTPTANPPALVA